MKHISLIGTTLAFLCVAAGSLSWGQGALTVSTTTRDDVDPRLIGLPAIPGSVPEQGAIALLAKSDALFATGMALFDKNFHLNDGLGTPEMNADSCRGCHQDPFIGGAGGLELNVSRFGDDLTGTFMNLPGGQGLSKLRPAEIPGREEYDPATANVFEQRQTPSILGAGLVDLVAAVDILANEDPNDANGDGIYGVARTIDVAGIQEIGRFGWKAQVPRLGDFLMDAMGGEMGLTCPDDGRGFALLADGDGVLDPEMSSPELDAILHFLSVLPAPERGGSHDPAVAQGEQLFASVGCATCHVPSLPGPNGPVPLYSNLLLHNVMPSTFRGMSEPGAGVGFFKTPPLWGIRDTAPYMHDGRAATLTEAILAHDGEALGVLQNYQALSVAEQRALELFLQDL